MKRKKVTTANYYEASLFWSVSDRKVFSARWQAVLQSGRSMSPTEAYATWGEPSTWPEDVYQHWLREATP